VVLAEVIETAAIEVVENTAIDNALSASVHTRTTRVMRYGSANCPQLATAIQHTSAQIGLLEVQEEPRVKATQLYHQASSH